METQVSTGIQIQQSIPSRTFIFGSVPGNLKPLNVLPLYPYGVLVFSGYHTREIPSAHVTVYPFKSTLSRFFPSKLRPRYSIVGNEVVWQLPFDGFVLKKTYKIKWKLRVDRGVTSGTQLPFILRVGSNMQDLIVTVL